jgi:hypothetical protein
MVFLCPSARWSTETFRVPSSDELQQAPQQKLVRLHRLMGGTYGYSLGYMVKDRYQSPKNLQRPNFALMADAPSTSGPKPASANHGECGQNVLFEDGHVALLADCTLEEGRDNIYLNDQGMVAPGLHMLDSVVAPSSARPQFLPVKAVR